jgi:CRISPR-associated protein Cas4
MLERSFRLKIAGVPLVGKIDRIDESEGSYEIIDYKTGEAKDKRKVDRDKQLTIYGMAAKEALGVKAEKLSLFFVETGEKVTTTRTDDEYEKERKYLEKTAKEIKNSSFKPKPGYPFPCGFCEYNKICPFASK